MATAVQSSQEGGGPFVDLDTKIEEMFEKADDLMINKKSYKEAVRIKF